MFQLTGEEAARLSCQFGISNNKSGGRRQFKFSPFPIDRPATISGMIDQIERVFHFLRSLQDDPNHAEQAREALRDFVKICDTLEDARQHLVMTMRFLKDRNEFMPKAAVSEPADEANLYDELSEHSRRLIRDTLADPPPWPRE